MTTSSTRPLPCELFSSRDTLNEAVAYSTSLILSLPSEHQAAAFTALHVTLNTALADLAKSSPATVQPYTPEELHLRGPFSVEEISQEETARHLRTALPHVCITLFTMGQLAPENFHTFTLLLAKYFELSPDELAREMLAIVNGE